jgi:prepilin peptidase CpaA
MAGASIAAGIASLDIMPTLDFIALWPTVTVVVIAAVIDFRTQRIPNWLTGPFLVAGLIMSGVRHGWGGLGESLVAALIATVILGLFCYLGGMGIGDLKLCAGIGSWIGPSQLASALVMTGLAGGLIALCWSLAGGFLRQTLRGVAALIRGFANRGFQPNETIVLANPLIRRMPYAPAIAIGTICSFLGRHQG